MTDEDDLTAAELALGLLDGDERAAALRRMLAEPDFATAVARWRDLFAGLLIDLPAVEPPPALAARALGPTGDAARPWRWATALASVAAAGLLAFAVLRPAPVPPAPIVQRPIPPLAAALQPTGKGKAFSAVYDRATGTLRLAGGPKAAPGRSAQLWSIGEDGAPRSLGLLGRDGRATLALTPFQRARLNEGVTLAVSLEPEGGSPKPTPTGPVVATGALERV